MRMRASSYRAIRLPTGIIPLHSVTLRYLREEGQVDYVLVPWLVDHRHLSMPVLLFITLSGFP